MEQFLTLNDLPSLSEAVNEAIELKKIHLLLNHLEIKKI